MSSPQNTLNFYRILRFPLSPLLIVSRFARLDPAQKIILVMGSFELRNFTMMIKLSCFLSWTRVDLILRGIVGVVDELVQIKH